MVGLTRLWVHLLPQTVFRYDDLTSLQNSLGRIASTTGRDHAALTPRDASLFRVFGASPLDHL